MKTVKLYAWYDKVDKTVLPGSLMASPSERSVCRGFISSFEKDRKMNIKEYELVCLGSIDEETGRITALPERRVVDYNCVYAPAVSTDGEVVDE